MKRVAPSNSQCPICFTSDVPLSRPLCGHKVCPDCMFEWALTCIRDSAKIPTFIKCPQAGCTRRLTIQSILDSSSPIQRDQIHEAFTKITLRNESIFIACPVKGCSYIGYYDGPESCTAPFECPVCSYTWKEEFQSDQKRKQKSFKENIYDALSELRVELTCETCPKCRVKIQKMFGCNHMVCSRCKFEFCWRCLHSFKQYRHNPNFICFLKSFVVFLFVAIGIMHVLSLVSLLHYVLNFLYFFFSGLIQFKWFFYIVNHKIQWMYFACAVGEGSVLTSGWFLYLITKMDLNWEKIRKMKIKGNYDLQLLGKHVIAFTLRMLGVYYCDCHKTTLMFIGMLVILWTHWKAKQTKMYNIFNWWGNERYFFNGLDANIVIFLFLIPYTVGWDMYDFELPILV